MQHFHALVEICDGRMYPPDFRRVKSEAVQEKLLLVHLNREAVVRAPDGEED